MNYIHQLNAFNDLLEVKSLSTGQIALWHALMAINNKCTWIEWFTVSNKVLEIKTGGLSRQGIYNARNALKQAGLIDFMSNGTKATSYKIINLYDSTMLDSLQDALQTGLQGTLQDTLQDSLQGTLQTTCTLNKQNKTKQKRVENSIPPTLEEVKSYCAERNNGISAEQFINFYSAKGWFIGKNKMKDWKAAVRTWEQRDNKTEEPSRRKLT